MDNIFFESHATALEVGWVLNNMSNVFHYFFFMLCPKFLFSSTSVARFGHFPPFRQFPYALCSSEVNLSYNLFYKSTLWVGFDWSYVMWDHLF